MRLERPCSNYIRGDLVCKSGFFSNHSVCIGLSVGCSTCGSTEGDSVPNCQKDDLPDHWLDDKGNGVFKPKEKENG